MNAAKMDADSTISDPPPHSALKRKKKSSIKKKSKKQKKEITKKNTAKETDDSDSDLDLTKDLKSLEEYVNERRDLLEQMFHCVCGTSLERALPAILKDLSLDDLKQRCLEQLECMSRKRITYILRGDDPADISSSGTEDETTDNQDGQSSHASDRDGQIIDSTSQVLEAEEGSSGSEYSENNPDQEYAEKDDNSEEEINDGHHSQSEEEGELHDDNPENFAIELDKMVQTQTKADMPPPRSNSLSPVLTQNQMELLELEMRARAIKAMLLSQSSVAVERKNGVSTNQRKPENTCSDYSVETSSKTKSKDSGKKGIWATTRKNLEVEETQTIYKRSDSRQATGRCEGAGNSRHRSIKPQQKPEKKLEKDVQPDKSGSKLRDDRTEEQVNPRREYRKPKLKSGEDPAILAMLRAKERAERERVKDQSDADGRRKRVFDANEESVIKKQKGNEITNIYDLTDDSVEEGEDVEVGEIVGKDSRLEFSEVEKFSATKNESEENSTIDAVIETPVESEERSKSKLSRDSKPHDIAAEQSSETCSHAKSGKVQPLKRNSDAEDRHLEAEQSKYSKYQKNKKELCLSETTSKAFQIDEDRDNSSQPDQMDERDETRSCHSDQKVVDSGDVHSLSSENEESDNAVSQSVRENDEHDEHEDKSNQSVEKKKNRESKDQNSQQPPEQRLESGDENQSNLEDEREGKDQKSVEKEKGKRHQGIISCLIRKKSEETDNEDCRLIPAPDLRDVNTDNKHSQHIEESEETSQSSSSGKSNDEDSQFSDEKSGEDLDPEDVKKENDSQPIGEKYENEDSQTSQEKNEVESNQEAIKTEMENSQSMREK
ncbi:hypothetical protein ScPMuIL_005401 [Solemya velum]